MELILELHRLMHKQFKCHVSSYFNNYVYMYLTHLSHPSFLWIMSAIFYMNKFYTFYVKVYDFGESTFWRFWMFYNWTLFTSSFKYDGPIALYNFLLIREQKKILIWKNWINPGSKWVMHNLFSVSPEYLTFYTSFIFVNLSKKKG